MPINSVKMKISKNKKMRFFLMSQWSLNPKIRFLGQKVCPVARPQTDGHTHRHTRKWLLRAPFQGFRMFSFHLSSRIGPKRGRDIGHRYSQPCQQYVGKCCVRRYINIIDQNADNATTYRYILKINILLNDLLPLDTNLVTYAYYVWARVLKEKGGGGKGRTGRGNCNCLFRWRMPWIYSEIA